MSDIKRGDEVTIKIHGTVIGNGGTEEKGATTDVLVVQLDGKINGMAIAIAVPETIIEKIKE